MHFVEWLLKIVPLFFMVSCLPGCYTTIGVDWLPDKKEGGAVAVSYQREAAHESTPRPIRMINR